MNKESAIKLLNKINEKFDSIALFPKSAPLLNNDYVKNKNIRKLLIDNYIAFYEVDDINKEIKIIRIIYGMQNYIDVLQSGGIIERLVRTILNDDIKFEAYDTLFWLYSKKENIEKMKDVFNYHIKDKLKKDYYSQYILEGEELTIYSQKEIRIVVDMLWDVMLSFKSNNSYDLETNIILTDKFNKIMTILYEHEDYGLQELWLLNIINRFTAIDCLKLDRIDDALNYIKLSVKYAIERDSRPNEFKHKSLLLNRLVDKQDNVTFSGNKQIYGNNCFTLYEDLQRGDFVKLKGNEEYIKLLEELGKHKKQYNQHFVN